MVKRVLQPLVLATALGCNTILGLGDPIGGPGDAGAGRDVGAGDATVTDGPQPEASSADAGVEAAVDAAIPCDAGDTRCDPDNCGVTFRSCKGGGCINGVCQPELLVAAPDVTSVGFANAGAGNDIVLWTTSTGVYSCLDPVCSAPIVIASNRPGPDSVATDGTDVYWTEPDASGGPYYCSHLGCDAGTPAQAMGGSQLGVLGTLSGISTLTWTDLSPPGAIYKCKMPGCTGATVLTATSAPAAGIVISNNEVYWAVDASIQEVAFAPDAAATIVSAQSGIAGLTVGSANSNLFWADTAGIMTCQPSMPGTCNAPKIMVSAPAGWTPAAILWDGTYLYWSSLGTIQYCRPPLNCTTTVTLAVTAKAVITSMASGDGALFWADATGVMRVETPPP
jgi:hypothetical protein